MRTSPMCFTAFRVPGCKVYSWVNTWRNGFGNLNRSCKEGHTLRLLSSSVREQGASRRWSRKPISTLNEGKSNKVLSSAANIRHGITDEVVTSVTRHLPIQKTDDRNNQQIQCTDVCQSKAENKDLAERAAFIAFDIETTGLSRQFERIVEIALIDIEGGDKSTFDTLVNPGRKVTNSYVHQITSKMVDDEAGVPRMGELIPILLQFVKSRQKPGGPVVLIAHNARRFDVPFLKSEFDRCSFEIPSDWLFLDTLPLSHRLWKSKGLKSSRMCSMRFLCDHYGIERGDAHRAKADATALTKLLRNLSLDLNLSKADLWQETFTMDELMNKSKNNGKGAK